MSTKRLSREEIANTEKKLDMPLDDIIKLSKNNTTKIKRQQRAPNKSQRTFNNFAKDKALRVRRYMDSRPFVRQGALAQRRSNFQGNQFPLTTAVARNAAVAPFRNRPLDRYPMANPNKARARTFPVNRRPPNGVSAAKPSRSQQQQPGDGNARQKPQTLDALFANMKEQRMKVMSRQNNNAPRNGNGGGRSTVVPWARGRFAR